MDYLSIDSDYGTVSKLYKETGKITSPMGELFLWNQGFTAHIKHR